MSNSLCACCGTRPIKIRSRDLCQACYSKLKRENKIHEYPAWPETVVIPMDYNYEWESRAACRDIDPDLFFDGDRFPDALSVCAACPVAAECRDLADACESRTTVKDRIFGIYGGETPAQRIARRRNISAAVLFTEQCDYDSDYHHEQRCTDKGRQDDIGCSGEAVCNIVTGQFVASDLVIKRTPRSPGNWRRNDYGGSV